MTWAGHFLLGRHTHGQDESMKRSPSFCFTKGGASSRPRYKWAYMHARHLMPANRSSPSPAGPSPRKKLDRPTVQRRISEILAAGSPDATALLAFAEFIHGKPFPEPNLSLAQLKAEVCKVFDCKDAKELRQSSEFNLAMGGRTFDLKTKADWQKLYREWVGVPQAERNRSGATCINGIDVLENFRPWHVFGLEPSNATADDIKDAFRRLAKEHHPDAGGDPRVMERLQKMRDSLLAFR